jgi:hypothetical protein
MKEPFKWFEEAVNSGKYKGNVIVEIKSCISEDGFDVNKFMDWVSEQLEKEIGED